MIMTLRRFTSALLAATLAYSTALAQATTPAPAVTPAPATTPAADQPDVAPVEADKPKTDITK